MKMEALVGGHAGLVREVHIIEPEIGDPRVWVATAEMASTKPIWGLDLVGSCGGAGLTESAAVASALGEAAERYAAAGQSRGDIFLGTPEVVCADPKLWRALIPAGWPPELPGAQWAWIKSRSGEPVPAALVFVPYCPLPSEWVPFPCISTGLAASSSIEEAAEKGFLEAVERDAVSRFWYGRGRNSVAVSLETANEDVQEVFKDCHARIRLFALDSFGGIPTAFCLLESIYGGRPLISTGSASASSWGLASRKALIEAAHDQSYVRFLIRKNDSSWPPETFEAHAAWPTRRPGDWLKAASFIESLPRGAAPISPSEYAPSASVNQIVRYTFDLTPSDLRSIGLSVARAVVPALVPLPGHDRMRCVDHPRFPKEANLWPHPMP